MRIGPAGESRAYISTASPSSSSARTKIGSPDPMAPGFGTTNADIGTLATSMGITMKKLSSFINDGGRITLVANSSGTIGEGSASLLAGLPIGDDGAPDFDAIIGKGGRVTGAIPPNGDSKITMVSGHSQTTFYAAEIDLGDGSAPRYVKGMLMNSDGKQGANDSLTYVANMVSLFKQIPNSITEAKEHANDDIFADRSPTGRFDHLL